VDNHCFSPESFDRPYNPESNIKCYISCPGTPDGGVSDSTDFQNILRFTPSQRAGRPVVQVLGELIYQVFGGELVRFCHFGTEACIIERLLDKMQSMKVDLRPIMRGSPIYNSKKHIEKLGLHRDLPGLCVRNEDRSDGFMKTGVWKTSGGGIGSEGASVNMWALLAAVSLVGCNHVHCKSSSRFAQSVLRLILESAPPAATPGDVLPQRSFHEVSKEVECVYVRSEERPENFLRPIDDGNFAACGIFTYCPVVDGEMPEDYLGCGYVREMSKFLKCKYYEVPPQHVHGYYQLIPDRHYATYNHERNVYGSLLITDTGATMQTSESDGFSWEFDEWEDMLRQENFLVMPMIWRSGALVSLGGGSVGCIVPHATRKLLEETGVPLEGVRVHNYNHFEHCYYALTDVDGELKALSVLDTFGKLISPGTFLWIRPETAAWEALCSQFTVDASLSQEALRQRAVRVRLNVPHVPNPEPGKVYVTVIHKCGGATHKLDFGFKHLVLDPWELTDIQPEDPAMEIKELLG
jgi:hypothetical protein